MGEGSRAVARGSRAAAGQRKRRANRAVVDVFLLGAPPEQAAHAVRAWAHWGGAQCHALSLCSSPRYLPWLWRDPTAVNGSAEWQRGPRRSEPWLGSVTLLVGAGISLGDTE
jgi:hypothetical protein